MNIETERKARLEAAGYCWILSYRFWIAHDRRKAFSYDAICDHDTKWLAALLSEPLPENEFWFYFRFLSNDPVRGCQGILADLSLEHLTPVIRLGMPRAKQLLSKGKFNSAGTPSEQ